MLYVLPDSAGDILVVQATETLSQSDYQDVFTAQINKQLKKDHRLRVLIYCDHNLTQIELASNWQPNKLCASIDVDIARIAIVSSGAWLDWCTDFNSEKVRHFTVTEFLTALHWCDEQQV